MKIPLLRTFLTVLAAALASATPAAAQYDTPLHRRLDLSQTSGQGGAVYRPGVSSGTTANATSLNSEIQRTSATRTVVAREAVADDTLTAEPALQPVPARSTMALASAPKPVMPIGTSIKSISPPVTHAPQLARMRTDVITIAQEPKAAVDPAPAVEPSSVAPADDFSTGCLDDCCDATGSGRRGRWLAGAEFLFARPHFSEATAFLVREGPVTTPGNVLAASDTWNYYEFDYEPSVRGYVAYRLDDCCSELRATYWRLDSKDSDQDTTNANATRTPTFFEVQPGPGNTLTANTSVAGDVFDVDFSRCIRTPETCSPCDCSGCPAWDLQWSAGARLARWDYNTDVFTNVATDGRIDIDQEFVGAGPKVGLEGRRYFGRCNQFSIYSSWDIALLVGWFEHDMARSIPSVGVNPATVEAFHNKMTRLVPVTEIELGTKWQPNDRWSVSAGWFFQCWWDLGMSTQTTSNLLGGLGPQFMLDDSNIMSWDGLTVKAEYSF